MSDENTGNIRADARILLSPLQTNTQTHTNTHRFAAEELLRSAELQVKTKNVLEEVNEVRQRSLLRHSAGACILLIIIISTPTLKTFQGQTASVSSCLLSNLIILELNRLYVMFKASLGVSFSLNELQEK